MELFFTGKSVEEATEKALEKLGIPREDISIEVVELPVRKLFGSKPAKIRVTLLGLDTQPKTEVQPEKKPEPKTEKAVQPAKAAEPKAEKKPQPKPEKKPQPVAAPAEQAPAKAAEAAASEIAEEAKPAKEVSPEKTALAKEFLETVAADMGLEGVTVTPQVQEETLILKVEGENLGMLIGRRGETMESLSYLTGLVANRLGGDYQKVALDVAGYRSKREGDLVVLAKRIGNKVAKSGRSYTMEPMNPYERRIIHATIGKMEGLTSESTGEGADRRVVISCTDPNAARNTERPRSGGRNNNRGRGGNNRSNGNRGGNRGNGPRSGENRGENRSNGNRGGNDRREAPRTEYKERSREQTAAPVAGERTETVNDAPSVSLYGKIEL